MNLKEKYKLNMTIISEILIIYFQLPSNSATNFGYYFQNLILN